MTKKCTRCKTEKPLDKKNFRTRKSKIPGKLLFRSECRECEKFIKINWEKNNVEKVKSTRKEYRERTRDSQQHMVMRLLNESKYRAKKKGIEHTVSKEEICIPKTCPVLGHELKCNKGSTASANSPSIDRKDNKKGYTKENIKVISFEANSIKGAATSEKLFKVALYAEECEGKGNFFTRWLKKLVINFL